VNMIQFDGINFIEHLSFNAFNEGTRLVKSIRYGRSLLARLPIFRPMTFMLPMQTVNTVQLHISLPTSSVREGLGKHEEHRQIISRELRKERTIRMEVALEQKGTLWTSED